MKRRTRKKALHRVIWMYSHKPYDKIQKVLNRYGTTTREDFYRWFATTKLSCLVKNEDGTWSKVD